MILYKFEKKLYEEQHDFNLKVLRHLQNVASLDSSVGRDEIEAGMSLIKERNKFLILADPFGWDVALCYAKEPLVEDSEDERKIRRAKKEGKIRKGRTFKIKTQTQKEIFGSCKNAVTCFIVSWVSWVPPPPPPNGPSIAIMCWRCKRPGHYARFCRAPIPPPPPLQFWTSTWVWWKASKPQYWSLELMFL